MSMTEVARMAGVSYSTVSRVVNQRNIVNDETARKVLRTMKEMGYTPPIPSRRRGPSMSTPPGQRTGVIALLWSCSIQRAMSPIGVPLMQGVMAAAAQHEFNVIVDQIQTARKLPAFIESGKVDGIIVQGPEPDPAILQSILPFPIVWMLTKGPRLGVDHIQGDNEAIGRLAAEKFVAMGCRTAACITSKPCVHTQEFWTSRAQGFQTWGKLLGLEVTTLGEDVESPEADSENPRFASLMVDRYFALPSRPDGLFIPVNQVLPIYLEFVRRGVRPVQDFPLIVVDRHYLSESGIDPHPIIIDIQAEVVGYMAVEHLLWRMAHKHIKARQTILVEPFLAESMEDLERLKGIVV